MRQIEKQKQSLKVLFTRNHIFAYILIFCSLYGFFWDADVASLLFAALARLRRVSNRHHSIFSTLERLFQEQSSLDIF